MTQHLIHLNDVIAPGDTSVLRLANQYMLLRPYFSDGPVHVHLIGSTFGDSQRTGTQLMHLITLLQEQHQLQEGSQTICVNNASRAKHTNSGNAKGSTCLRATIEHEGQAPLHIVGVDDHVFGSIRNHITSLQEVRGIQRNETLIEDISAGSQFRSLEFWPLVQYIVQYAADPLMHLSVQPKDIATLPETELLPAEDSRWMHLQTLSSCLQEGIAKELSHDGYTIYPQGEASVCIQGDTDLHKTFQQIQLEGETQKTRTLRNLSSNDTTPPLSFPTLLPNELLVIDKDKFGNIKTCSAHANGIHGLANVCNIAIGNKVHVSMSKNGQHIEDTAYLVHSISDKTGEKCIWNGSSRGPNGEVFVELNRSIDESYQGWEFAQRLQIGDKLQIKAL